MKAKGRILILCLLLAAAAWFVNSHTFAAPPVTRPLSDVPTRLPGWTMTTETRFDDRVLGVLRPSDYLFREYVDDNGNRVRLYVGYHDGGPDSGPIHSPRHCLPGSGWMLMDQVEDRLPIGDQQVPLVCATYRKGESGTETFLYWYQMMGRRLTGDFELKLFKIFNAMFHNRRDAAFVRISVPDAGTRDDSRRIGESFARAVYPYLQQILPE
ncbi:MAG: EpsI family protein [Geothermobacteraceae bacterium]